MKKKIRLLLSIILAMTLMLGISVNSFALSGAGTEESPYLISSLQAGADLGSDFWLKNDLDCTVYVYADAGTYGGLYCTKYYITLTKEVPSAECDYLYLTLNSGQKDNQAFHITVAGVSLPQPTPPEPAPAPTHTHEFIEGTITEPTADSDGVGGVYCKSCGYVKESYPISAGVYLVYDYGTEKIKASQPGQTTVLEFGEWNSFPKAFMADLAAKSAAGVTFEFHYKWNHEQQTIIIPAGVTVDLNEEWYGPAKMRELYLQYSVAQ